MRYLLLFLTFLSFGQVQKFIPIDEDTFEFIPDVNYVLYTNKKPIFYNTTSNDSVTRFPKNTNFDSISFSKLNFKEFGIKREYLTEVIYLKKIKYELDEVVVSNSNDNEIEVGEKTRFVKRQSNSIPKGLEYGLLFSDSDLKNKEIKKLIFYVEKVTHKTTYRIKFYSAREIGSVYTGQTLELGEIKFESPILTLEKGCKNKVEVDLGKYNIDAFNESMFVCFELDAYYNDNNDKIEPSLERQTKLKFQLSNQTNYYAKTSDYYTKMPVDEIVNINAMINRDFASMFFKKPHKSNLVAPAIILYCTRENSR